MAVSNLFYRNIRLTALSLVLLSISSVVAFQQIGRQEDPALPRRFGFVLTNYPGASAERVETQVTEVLEREIREIPEIKKIESFSRYQLSNMQVELADTVAADEVDIIWSRVRDRLNGAELPGQAQAPDLTVRSIAATSVLVALRWGLDTPPQLRLLSRLSRDLELQLGNIEGTFRTEVFGEIEEEIEVNADAAALTAANISARQFAAALQRADARHPAGLLSVDSGEFPMEVGGTLDSVERIARIPVGVAAGGQVLRVGDLATVTKGARRPERTMALVEGARAVVVSAKMQDNLRIDHWAGQAHKVIDDFRAQMPRGVIVDVLFDQNTYTSTRLLGLLGNLLFGVAIVFFLLVFLMGARSGLAVGLALPMTMAMVLVEMNLIGLPLHQMSVTGLVMSLGLLIDNAIVVVEGYKLSRLRGLPIADAITDAVRRLWAPLLASTLTTVFAFMPVALAPGGTGDFTGALGVTISLSVLSSLVLSLTLILSLNAYMERLVPMRSDANLSGWYNLGYRPMFLTGAYRRSLQWVLKSPWRGLLVGLVLPVTGFMSLDAIPKEFFPPTDRNQFQIQLNLPTSATLQQTEAHVQRIRKHLEKYPEVVSSTWFLGEPMPRVYYNLLSGADGLPNYASGFVTTRNTDDARRILAPMARELIETFPDSQVMALPYAQGPPVRSPVEVRLTGPDLNILRGLGEQVRAVLARVPNITYTTATMGSGRLHYRLSPIENELAQAGLSLSQLPNELRVGLDGQIVGLAVEGNEQLPVRVRVREFGSVQEVGSLPLRTRGTDAPLEQFARLQIIPGRSAIEHYQGQRVNVISGYVAPYVLPAETVELFRHELAESQIVLPAGYQMTFGGEEEERSESVQNLLATFVIFLILIVGVIVIAMNSFREAALVLGVGLLSVGLGILGVRLSGYPLGFTAIIGTLGLMGVSINGAIVVLSAMKSESGDIASIEGVVLYETRHIISTTLTTMGGFLPLILAGGTFWPPPAMAIAAGVFGSAVLALYMVPSLYVWMRKPATVAVL